MATDPGAAGYQSVLSLLTAAVVGKGIFYDLTMFSGFAGAVFVGEHFVCGFSSLCRMIARDDYLPHSLAGRGRRLVFSQGIWGLAILGALLLILFWGRDGPADSFICGGSVSGFHVVAGGWWTLAASGARSVAAILVNGIGALATGITVVVILVAKFAAGLGWWCCCLPTALVFMGRRAASL